ncbi:hypothetical protein L1887_56879 [Cichorium endivia]|nr:hypothetical protein L1887_56879 [Cichorium endivia]
MDGWMDAQSAVMVADGEDMAESPGEDRGWWMREIRGGRTTARGELGAKQAASELRRQINKREKGGQWGRGAGCGRNEGRRIEEGQAWVTSGYPGIAIPGSGNNGGGLGLV